MNRELYANSINTIQIAAGLVAQIDIPEVLSAIERADAVGPILDPTLYQRGAARLDDVRRLVEAAAPLRAEALRQLEERRAANLRMADGGTVVSGMRVILDADVLRAWGLSHAYDDRIHTAEVRGDRVEIDGVCQMGAAALRRAPEDA